MHNAVCRLYCYCSSYPFGERLLALQTVYTSNNGIVDLDNTQLNLCIVRGYYPISCYLTLHIPYLIYARTRVYADLFTA